MFSDPQSMFLGLFLLQDSFLLKTKRSYQFSFSRIHFIYISTNVAFSYHPRKMISIITQVRKQRNRNILSLILSASIILRVVKYKECRRTTLDCFICALMFSPTSIYLLLPISFMFKAICYKIMLFV